MMKKIMFLILICGVMIFSVCPVFAQKVAVKSDIKAYIDYTPIGSYNVDGYTYVIAEELRNYGFDVIWNNDERTLKIIRKELTSPIYTKELFEADTDPVSSSYLIYPTDIKTYLNDIQANSFNIGGQTVIQIDELARCGNFEWDAENREVKVTIYEAELKNLYEQAENKVEITKTEWPTMTYVGQVNEDGEPDGIGWLRETDSYSGAGVSYIKTDETIGFFRDGKACGKIYLNRYLTAGKVGESISIKFIGNIDSFKTVERSFKLKEDYYQIESIVRESNFGNVALPYHYMKDYMDYEVHRDTRTYLNGVWFEDNGYRGQKGVTFRSWYDGNNYQSVLKTDLDEQNQIITTFEDCYDADKSTL